MKGGVFNRSLKFLIDGKYSNDVVSSWIQPEKEAIFKDIPQDIHPILHNILFEKFPHGLFAHQVESWNLIKAGKNVTISTGTSSGKSLCYFLPVFDEIMRNENATSLLLFPTKALTSDQLLTITDYFKRINSKLDKKNNLFAAIYDGDTAQNKE